MTCREKIAPMFYIEEHAVLYALLVRAARTLYGQQGTAASISGTKLYATQRGNRMAARTLADGRECTPLNYMIYSEWQDSKSWSEGKTISLSPVHHTQTLRCGWYDSWRKHDLLEDGKLYCEYVDAYLVKGYNPNNQLELRETLSHEGCCCDFYWIGRSFSSEQELRQAMELAAQLSPKTVKDFLYHSGHLLSAMSQAYTDCLGEEAAQTITNQALEEFKKRFGKEKWEALLLESNQDFTKAD